MVTAGYDLSVCNFLPTGQAGAPACFVDMEASIPVDPNS